MIYSMQQPIDIEDGLLVQKTLEKLKGQKREGVSI